MKKMKFKTFFCFVLALTLVFCSSCGGNSSKKSEESLEKICAGKKCSSCGAAAEHYYITGGISYTSGYAPNSYEKVGELYRVFFCTPCWNKMPKAQSPI